MHEKFVYQRATDENYSLPGVTFFINTIGEKMTVEVIGNNILDIKIMEAINFFCDNKCNVHGFCAPKISSTQVEGQQVGKNGLCFLAGMYISADQLR